ncbi:MAG: hypothetical protein NTZ44_00560 [Candidatus Nomurabacteria bacterium]|nr:hypothetical protein [Candidatus Nomurabacteria bacterium]
MENEKIAIDIVLLLPPEIVEKCIFVNSQLDNSGYVSFTNGYNPHITLGMGCIFKKDLDIVKNKIQKLSEKIKPLNLTTSGYSGERTFGFAIEKNSELMTMHDEAISLLKEIASYGDATYEMFNESEKVKDDPGLVKWVSNFVIEHSGELYDPHISLGKGDKPKTDFPISFTVNKIGLFHIGQRGSCKEKLAEFMLE